MGHNKEVSVTCVEARRLCEEAQRRISSELAQKLLDIHKHEHSYYISRSKQGVFSRVLSRALDEARSLFGLDDFTSATFKKREKLWDDINDSHSIIIEVYRRAALCMQNPLCDAYVTLTPEEVDLLITRANDG